MGKALWESQGFERMLATHLVILGIKKKPSEDELLNALQAKFAHSLGLVWKKHKESSTLDPEFEKRINEFKQERDWLVHQLYRLNFEDLHSEDAFCRLISRVDHLAEEAMSLIKIFDGLIIAYFQARGLSPEEIRKVQQAEIENWKII